MSATDKFSKDFFKQFKSKEEFHSFFNDLFKQGVQEMLKAELEAHLGYEKYSKQGYGSGNSRNGSYPKRVKTESLGDMVLSIPRDRNAEFEPQLIPKGQRMSDKLEEAVVGMYSRGMSCSDIRSQVKEIYGVNVSETTVSNITNRLMEHIRQWQDRPLEQVYYILWMDGIQVKIRQNGKYTNKCIYLVIGLKKNGYKEVLGLWMAESESASFWMSVLTDLKGRGVQDILVACTDNLAGFTQAIHGVFPQAITQICIVHQVRNSCKYVLWKDRKEFCANLRNIYTATNIEMGEMALQQMDQKWGAKYRHAIQPWHNNWENLSRFFQFPLEIRNIMYTTNIIENMNRGIRKYTKTKVQFPDDQAAIKAVYMAMINIEKKWTHPIKNWALIIYQFETIFEERCKIDENQFSGVYTK